MGGGVGVGWGVLVSRVGGGGEVRVGGGGVEMMQLVVGGEYWGGAWVVTEEGDAVERVGVERGWPVGFGSMGVKVPPRRACHTPTA